MEDKGITTVNNTLIRDKELSLTAKGLGVLMLSLDNYSIAWNDIEGYGTSKELKQGLNELISQGYVNPTCLYPEDAKKQRIAYEISDTPIFRKQSKVKVGCLTHVAHDNDFNKLPQSVQAFYFHLFIDADDDGYVNPYRIINRLGWGKYAIEYLLDKGFISAVEDNQNVVLVDALNVPDFFKEEENL